MLEPVAPLNPPAPYLGGKANLAERIIARIEAIPHASYVEPFFGMGGVFFRRSFRPKAEIINDLNGELVRLFRCIQRHPQELMRTLRWLLASRELFTTFHHLPVAALTDIERAAVFYYRQKMAFGGKVAGQAFGTQKEYPSRFQVSRIRQQVEAMHRRLEPVVIENLPYHDLLPLYDHAGALFYLDPPYFNGEEDYGKGMFSRADFTRLAELLRGIKGAFVLSLNDVPEVREIFTGFILEEVSTTYSINSKENKRVGELIISNRELVQERLL